MNAFWLITAAMLLVALVLLIPVLLRKQNLEELDRDAQNVRIARERLAELEAEHREGTLTDDVFEQAKLELEQGLLVDLGGGGSGPSAASPFAGRAAAGGLLVMVPAAVIGLYTVLGAPEHLDVKGPGSPAREMAAAHASTAGSGDGALPSVEEMVEGLQQRLAENPEDPNGWYLLGRTYMSLNRYRDAITAYERVQELAGDHPRVLVSLADAVAMAEGGSMAGRPTELVTRALEIAPNDTTALWLAGLAAEERGDLEQAVTYWTRLYPLLSDKPGSQQQVRALIARAGGEAPEPATALPSIMPAGSPAPAASATADKGAADAGGRSLTVTVSLADPVRASAQPDDTVFVFARAAEGPPMPLAVARRKVRDLPITVVLDDSMAMMPAMSLSKFDRVQVAARVSKSGSAQASSGDLQSESVLVAERDPGTIELVIAQPVP